MGTNNKSAEGRFYFTFILKSKKILSIARLISNNETTFVIPLKGFGGTALEEEELMIFISQTEIVF